jgi:hypothetical protein
MSRKRGHRFSDKDMRQSKIQYGAMFGRHSMMRGSGLSA